MDAVELSSGWGVLHLFYKVDRARAEADPRAGKRVVDAVQSLEADGHQALVFAVLGHKADLGVMALGPDLARLQAFQQELVDRAARPRRLVRVVHRAVGVHVDRGRRARPARGRGGPRPARQLEARLAAWRERMAHYREQRLHPQLPLKRVDLLLPDVEAARERRRQLVLAAVRRAQAAHGRPRPGRAHLRGAGAAAHHRLHRARRLGVGRHAARRRPGRAEGDRLRDALRPGVGRLRRVRAVRHRPAAPSRPTRSQRVGLSTEADEPWTTCACSCRSRRSSSTAR